jgi:hypothetical protein
MRRILLESVCFSLVGIFSVTICQTNLVAQDVTHTEKKHESGDGSEEGFDGTTMDVAILLDTSGSMDGLINQAKAQLWNIVQEFASAEKSGSTPLFRVSVFEYGNNSLPAKENYIRQVCGLTDDLDKVSEVLFSLRTNGGSEYCGAVIQDALQVLDWSTGTDSYKAIFIAGNEPFNQGPAAYKEACASAVASGILVNTIHCGNSKKGIQQFWQDAAVSGGGKYLNIDQDRQVIHVDAPQDSVIIKLSSDLNRTYLWFGEADIRGGYSKNQQAQDLNAGSNSVSRAVTKAGKLYSNSSRDLVDSYKKNRNILAEVEENCLPDVMQTMSKGERLAHIETMANKRKEIQYEIDKLNNARLKYIETQKEKLTASKGEEDATLGDVMREAVRAQLIASGFDVE